MTAAVTGDGGDDICGLWCVRSKLQVLISSFKGLKADKSNIYLAMTYRL